MPHLRDFSEVPIVFEYETLTEDELLHIAGENEQLTDEAKMVLDAELRRRNLSAQKIQAYAAESAAADEADRLRRAAPRTVSNGSFGMEIFRKGHSSARPEWNFRVI
jgi:hypothetical protein